MAKPKKKKKEKRAVKKKFTEYKGPAYDPYKDLSMPSDTFSEINNAQALESEKLNTLSQMSFQELNPEAFNSGTVRSIRPEEEGGFRGKLADATEFIQQGGAPTDFLSELTFIPSLSRVFGDPDRGQYGAARQVYETIKENPGAALEAGAYLPLLDFIPAGAGASKVLRMGRQSQRLGDYLPQNFFTGKGYSKRVQEGANVLEQSYKKELFPFNIRRQNILEATSKMRSEIDDVLQNAKNQPGVTIKTPMMSADSFKHWLLSGQKYGPNKGILSIGQGKAQTLSRQGTNSRSKAAAQYFENLINKGASSYQVVSLLIYKKLN